LPRGKESGLKQVGRILGHVPGIEFIHFSAEDVVRHPLVQKIVAAYEREESQDGRRDGE
jgi:phosphate starvation-inducible PhoH-like protein